MAVINGKLWKDRIQEAIESGSFTEEDDYMAQICTLCVWGEVSNNPKEIATEDIPKAVWDFSAAVCVNNNPAEALNLYNKIHLAYGELLMKEWGLE